MSGPQAPCPAHSVVYNKTLCACAPGYLFNATTKSCTPFNLSPYDWVVNSGVDYSISFPETIFSFDQIKKFTQSQAVFLEITAFLLATWLLFCGLVRLAKLEDGRTVWFKIRWWISRLDICFSTKHYLEDQKVVRKRKTELGGTFSIASWILFIGLLSALLYQIISKRTVEVHNLRATNAPDLVSFVNDLEFNITTISTMSCSQLRGLGTLVLGNPGAIDYRVTRLSTFANYSCFNTSQGPRISLTCNNCPLTRDNVYVSWQFVDIPNEPASAVGFQFNLTARNNAHKKHVSVVSGTVRNGTDLDDMPVTFRGVDTNILKFNLFPRIYHNLHNLKLVQPLFHEFIPGSFLTNANELQTSLQSSNIGLINTTLSINFLSAYIVEIDSQNILGPVSFLADLGGLYCFSIGIFFYFLVQFEYRIKRLRNEDQVFRDIRRRRKAQEHWDKLRKYVIYRWGPRTLLEEISSNDDSCCTCVSVDPFKKKESLHKRLKRENSLHEIGFGKSGGSPKETVNKNVSEPVKSVNFSVETGSRPLASTHEVEDIPPPPPKLDGGSSADMSDIQKNLQNLYEYNTLLRDKLVHTQSMLRALTTKSPSPTRDSQGQT